MNDFPKIMGILNVTPDSFSDGGKYFETSKAIEHALMMIDDGADIIDIGGESTRPGAEEVPIDEEIKRIEPVISGIRRHNKEVTISIDTRKYEVAKIALESGANIINDISGLTNDIRILELGKEFNCSLIIMHIQGTPKTMQNNPYYNNVVEEVFNFLNEKINICRNFGVHNIIADVGIGFGKNYEHNIELLRNIAKFKELNVPLLLGISRKSFIGKMTGIVEPENRDIPTALIHALLLNKSIDIIRVHNVKLLSVLKIIYESLKK